MFFFLFTNIESCADHNTFVCDVFSSSKIFTSKWSLTVGLNCRRQRTLMFWGTCLLVTGEWCGSGLSYLPIRSRVGSCVNAWYFPLGDGFMNSLSSKGLSYIPVYSQGYTFTSIKYTFINLTERLSFVVFFFSDSCTVGRFVWKLYLHLVHLQPFRLHWTVNTK